MKCAFINSSVLALVLSGVRAPYACIVIGLSFANIMVPIAIRDLESHYNMTLHTLKLYQTAKTNINGLEQRNETKCKG
jgi:hypothetical protein